MGNGTPAGSLSRNLTELRVYEHLYRLTYGRIGPINVDGGDGGSSLYKSSAAVHGTRWELLEKSIEAAPEKEDRTAPVVRTPVRPWGERLFFAGGPTRVCRHAFFIFPQHIGDLPWAMLMMGDDGILFFHVPQLWHGRRQDGNAWPLRATTGRCPRVVGLADSIQRWPLYLSFDEDS